VSSKKFKGTSINSFEVDFIWLIQGKETTTTRGRTTLGGVDAALGQPDKMDENGVCRGILKVNNLMLMEEFSYE